MGWPTDGQESLFISFYSFDFFSSLLENYKIKIKKDLDFADPLKM